MSSETIEVSYSYCKSSYTLGPVYCDDCCLYAEYCIGILAYFLDYEDPVCRGEPLFSPLILERNDSKMASTFLSVMCCFGLLTIGPPSTPCLNLKEPRMFLMGLVRSGLLLDTPSLIAFGVANIIYEPNS